MSMEASTKLATISRDQLLAVVQKYYCDVRPKKLKAPSTFVTKTDTAPAIDMEHDAYLEGKFGASSEEMMEIAPREVKKKQTLNG
uniref:Uncharacterized protein n=1 Tax=Peronospora matthiolae TaxID=2874970 RepID=A0AAV1U099_9STRA